MISQGPIFELGNFLENQILNLRFHIEKKFCGWQENYEENDKVNHGYFVWFVNEI